MATSEKRLPPLNAIVAFEAAARHLSFTRAAAELHLSQSAVSRQVQGLEGHLGTALFQRQHKDLKLTRAGAIFHDTVGQCLSDIRQSIHNIENLSSSNVTIAASVGMSSFWLMPAILEFREKFPDINIRVIATDELPDVHREHIDLSIRYGDGNWPGLAAVKLLNEELFPVCSIDYLKRQGISRVSDLSKETLIDLDKSLSPFGRWSTWLHKAQIRLPSLPIAMVLSNYDLVYRALCSGKGIGLAWSYAIPIEVRENLLVRPMDAVVRTGLGEYIVFPAGKTIGKAASAVIEWLTEYAKKSVWDVG